MASEHDTEENQIAEPDTGGIVVAESEEITPAVVETCGDRERV